MVNINELTKKDIVVKFGGNDKNTGLSEVQIAILTKEILNLTEHLKNNKKDKHSKVGLQKKVSRRSSILSYLKRVDENRYLKIKEELNLRK